MSEPLLKHVQCVSTRGLHRMAYWEWPAAPGAPTVVCVHGLTRQGRDFDALARVLSPRWRVICPDVVGRGASAWLPEPSGYQIPQYVADMVTLLARLDVCQVDWVGTSMGGLIGMGLAAMAHTPIRRLVLNDVGPVLEWSALSRIGGYVGREPRFADREEGDAYLRQIQAGFGPHTDAEWAALNVPMLRPTPEGDWRLHHDPAIGAAFAAATPESTAAGTAVLWATYDAIRCPTLLMRGMDSDLLSAATASAMTQRGPQAQVVAWPGVGHAPTLVDPAQIAAVDAFLSQPSQAA